MNLGSVSTSLADVLKDLTRLAESEIEKELEQVARHAIEANREKIIAKVKAQYMVACHTRLIQTMDRAGMYLEFSFQPKGGEK